MDDQLYREIILEHWKNPQNWGVIDDADVDISDSNPLCGDQIRLTLKLGEGETFNLKFMGEGCAISKASGSILTELVKEIGLDKFRNLDQASYLENLEVDLTPARLKCALLPYSTLKKGLQTS